MATRVSPKITVEIYAHKGIMERRRLGRFRGLTEAEGFGSRHTKIQVYWDCTKEDDPIDTLLHEMVHVIEDIFGITRTHNKRFYRVLKVLNKEFNALHKH